MHWYNALQRSSFNVWNTVSPSSVGHMFQYLQQVPEDLIVLRAIYTRFIPVQTHLIQLIINEVQKETTNDYSKTDQF